jgi:hypothetical protein
VAAWVLLFPANNFPAPRARKLSRNKPVEGQENFCNNLRLRAAVQNVLARDRLPNLESDDGNARALRIP